MGYTSRDSMHKMGRNEQHTDHLFVHKTKWYIETVETQGLYLSLDYLVFPCTSYMKTTEISSLPLRRKNKNNSSIGIPGGVRYYIDLKFVNIEFVRRLIEHSPQEMPRGIGRHYKEHLNVNVGYRRCTWGRR